MSDNKIEPNGRDLAHPLPRREDYQTGLSKFEWLTGSAPDVPAWFVMEWHARRPVDNQVVTSEMYFAWRVHYANEMLKLWSEHENV